MAVEVPILLPVNTPNLARFQLFPCSSAGLRRLSGPRPLPVPERSPSHRRACRCCAQPCRAARLPRALLRRRGTAGAVRGPARQCVLAQNGLLVPFCSSGYSHIVIAPFSPPPTHSLTPPPLCSLSFPHNLSPLPSSSSPSSCSWPIWPWSSPLVCCSFSFIPMQPATKKAKRSLITGHNRRPMR